MAKKKQHSFMNLANDGGAGNDDGPQQEETQYDHERGAPMNHPMNIGLTLEQRFEAAKNISPAWDRVTYFTWNDLTGMRDKIDALEAELREAKQEIDSLQVENDALHKKYEDCPHPKIIDIYGSETACACSYDKASDVCALHAPQLKAALAENAQLKQQVEGLSAPVSESELRAHFFEADSGGFFLCNLEAAEKLIAARLKGNDGKS